MTTPSVLFVIDAGDEVGGGHVMRSLTMADALYNSGARPAFLCSPYVTALLVQFGFGQLGRVSTPAEEPSDLAEAALVGVDGFDAVVFDHFRLGAREHYRIARGRPSLAIDDLADRQLGVDMVLDVGPARTEADYAGLVEPGCRLLLGPGYALVLPGFAAVREGAMARRAGSATVARVLVSLGLTDLGGITAKVVNRLLPRLGEAELDVVVGPHTASLPEMQRLAARDRRVTLHIGTQGMDLLCARADLAVGAGGSSTWERCAVGLPTVLVVVADNQEPGARAMADAGAAEVVDARTPDFEAAFDRAFTGLMRSPERRGRMGRTAAELCDGLGAARAADEFLQLITTPNNVIPERTRP